MIENLEQWPVGEFYSDRKKIVQELFEMSMSTIMSKYDGEIQDVLKQTIHAEIIRSKNIPWKIDPPNEVLYWRKLQSEYQSIAVSDDDSNEQYQELLKRIVNRYAEEIPGNFNPKTFQFARKFLTKLFGAIYNPWYKKDQNNIWWGNRAQVLDKFKVTGPIEKIQKLFDKTSVVVLPTHISNLDSPLIGYGIEMMTGLPAFSYGAGLNLYDYELAAYYISRLGAYTIDRRKRNAIYLNTLKQFSVLSLLKDLNTVFFPGGTRSRSGAIEDNLKYGLMATMIESQNINFKKGLNKKIMVIPLVVSYHFVLEAEELISQHLRKTGKANYISSRKKKKQSISNLIQRFLKSDSEVYLSFGEPLDVFGNQLDENANSIKNGQVIDIKEHFMSGGEVTMNKQRNDVYTRVLSKKIIEEYKSNNIVLSSHVVNYVGFKLAEKMYSELDFYTLISINPNQIEISSSEFLSMTDQVINELKAMERSGELKLSQALHQPIEDVINDGLKHLKNSL